MSAPKLIAWEADSRRREYRASIGPFDVVVHTFVHGDPDNFYVTCHRLDLDRRPLAQRDIKLAQVAALSVVRDAIELKVRDYKAAVDALEADVRARR